MSTIRLCGGAAALAALVSASSALAHATLEVGEAPADSTYKAVLRIPHGCDGQPTHTVTVTMPEGFIDVRPMPKPGWRLATRSAPFAKTYDLWGEQVSSGVTEVEWSGGELPDAYYDEFVFRGRVTGFEAGTVLPFKVVQTCPDGEVAWVNVAGPGEDPHDIDHPAPTVTVVAGRGGDHTGHAGHTASATTAGSLTIGEAWMRQPPPGAAVAGGYMTITNTGASDDTLVGAAVPFAGRVEIHEMAVSGGVMTMKPVEGGLRLPAGETVALSPGGFHIMMMDLTAAPKAGEQVPVTLEFEKAGSVELMMSVAPIGAARPGAPAGAGAHDHGSHVAK